MAASESHSDDNSPEIGDRTRRALEQCMTVTPNIGRAKDAPGLAIVTSESGSSYTVDMDTGTCGCPDSEHRDPAGGCKHVRRARIATGRRPVPAEFVEACDVDPDLGQCTDATVDLLAADGGVIDGAK